jgi:hypothetical protein
VAVIVVGLPAPAVLAGQLVELFEPDGVRVPVQSVTGSPAEVVVNVTVPVGAVVPVVGLTVAEYVTFCPNAAVVGFAVTETTEVAVPCIIVSLVDGLDPDGEGLKFESPE